MVSAIPFFYADLIARIVPGAIALALLALTTFEVPQQWILPTTLPAHVVLIPVLYAGVAYVIGTVLEVALSRPLECLYELAFTAAARTHAWSDGARDNRTARTARELSRATFGQFIVGTPDSENQAIAHVVRFHSEAKMCAATAFLVVAAIGLAFIDWASGVALVRPEGHNVFRLWLLIPALVLLVYSAHQRLESRARFVIRAIDRVAADKPSSTWSVLRDQVRALGADPPAPANDRSGR